MEQIIESIEKKAGQALRTAGLKQEPTDLARVLAALRLHHERPWHLKQDTWEALARPSRGRTRIQSQGSALTPKRRWRLGHEIAHHVMHGAEPHLRAGDWETHELEYEADLYAAALLMPRPWLERALKDEKKRHDSLDIDALAKRFGVGSKEMEKRLRQLGLLAGEVLGRM